MIGRRDPGVLAGSNRLGGLQPSHVRHLQIHQDDVEGAVRLRLDGRNRLETVLDCPHLVTALLQQFCHQLAVHEVVFGNEDVKGAGGGAARRCRRVARTPRRHAKQRRKRVEQVRVLYRLAQTGVDTQLPAARRVVGRCTDVSITIGVSVSRSSRRMLRASANPSTSGIWQSETTAWNRSFADAARRRVSSAAAASDGRGRLHVPARQHFLENSAVRRVVVDDEDAQVLERLWSLDDPARFGARCDVEIRGEMKRAAPVHLALDPDGASHQLDQSQRDGQAQTGAAIAARRRAVGLRERLEDLLLLVRWNADAGVLHGEVQRHMPRRR